MEMILRLVIPALGAMVLVRTLLLPLRWSVRLAAYSGLGFASLWLLNLASGITDIAIPVNSATVFVAGTLGLPGIGLLALLELL